MKKFTSLSAIQEVADLPPVPVFVKEWEGEVYVRQLTASQAQDFHEVVQTNLKEAGFKLLVQCVVNPETKQPIFTDIEEVKALPYAPVKTIQDECIRINRLSNSKEEVKEVKNASGETDDSVSPTDSPAN